MPPKNLPTILLVPGAFGKPDGFDSLLPYLHEAGFATYPGAYPSCNPANPHMATCENDITFLRNNVLLPLLEQHKDVIILAHSYGGIVAGGAAKDFDKTTREAQGHVSSIVGLIYVVGNITLEGESLLQAVGGAYPPFIKENKPELAKQMNLHSLLAFSTASTAPAWANKGFDGVRAYIRTLEDFYNPSWLQDSWLEKSKVYWDVVDFNTGHMPFVSKPKELAATIIRLGLGFMVL
ncbi:Alpha/Beta hydrolase protein [Xylaria cubensis]|nr:Alpha/Beta hydrolase protein [Xylaria cubensis]